MDARSWFEDAALGFRVVVGGIGTPQLSHPGLGEWDVRSLLGHTTRAFLTIESYLDGVGAGPTLDGAVAYYRAAANGLADPAQVTERGRAAGVALGEDPVAAAVQIADRVVELVALAPDDAPVATPVGTMTLATYLPSRAFELSVHGLDLARATEQDVPAALLACAAGAAELCVALASPDDSVAVLLALTGRAPLPADFTVLP